MDRIRVAQIVARMNVGGPAVEIAELMRGLDSDRFEQRLFTGWCSPDEADYLLTQASDVAATRVEGLGRAVRPLDDARVLPRLIQQLRAFEPDIVHTHTAKAGVLGRLAAKLSGTGTAVVHTHHGHLLHGYFSPSKTRAVIETERGLSRITDDLITVGVKVRDDLLAARIGRPAQYSVIRSGVVLRDIPERSTARVAIGLDQDVAVVSMIGRLTRIKRPDRFADAVEILSRLIPDVVFLVAGSGDEEGGLRARVEARHLPVTLLGWRSDIETILAASDLVILTSDNEGTPLSLVQAGLAGVPSVATDVGAVSEVVDDGVTGLLTATTAKALAEGVRTLLDDPDLRRRFGSSAREKAISEYGLEGFLNGHSDIYERLGRRRRPVGSSR